MSCVISLLMKGSRMNKALFPVVVLITSEAVLQYHGIRFWIEHGGPHGWIWSVALGVAAVWFWLHRSAWLRYGLGITVSVLLLAGPLWQVSEPLATSIEKRYKKRYRKG